MKMKLSASLLLVVLSAIQSHLAQSDSLSVAANDRALYNDKWPPKQIPVRRYHQWSYTGAATSSQYRKGTNRAVGHRPEYYDDDHQGEEEEYYYEPTDDHVTRPSETKFEHYEKRPKHTKQDRNSGKGLVGKSSKSDECVNYHYEMEYEYEIYPDEEMDDSEYYDSGKHSGKYYGKGTRGGHKDGKKETKSSKSKSSKKTKICTDSPIEAPPTVSPYPTSSNPPFDESPSSTPGPDEPTSYTPSPTSEDSVAVTLPAFALAYDVPNLRQPTREELDALEAATRLYLENFFFDEFDGNSFTVLDDFITELLEASFVQGLPIEVDYLSTARFNPFSTIIPTDVQLNSALIEAFTGVNVLEYEVFLNEELPEDNVFVGSTVLFLQEEGGEESPDNTRSGIGITGITAAAVAFTLLVAGFVIYKRRNDNKEPETEKLNKADGTVAGETFTGETYDGTASVSAASLEYARRYHDEDETSKTVSNLGTIPESGDDDDVSPEAWKNEADEYVKTAPTRSSSNSAFRNGVSMESFEEIALQGPAHGEATNLVMLDTLSSSQEESLSGEKMQKFSSTMKFGSSSSYDSMDGGSPSMASSLSIREGSARRPRTVAEIEALLSADLGHGMDDISAVASEASGEESSRRSTNRPRTVEEIESLLHADLEDESVLELPFSDEDETIDAEKD